MGYRILVADPDRTAAAALVDHLSRSDAETSACVDLKALSPMPPPDVLLIASELLDPEGRSRLQDLRQRAPELPVILLQKPGGPEIEERLIGGEIVGTFPKPVDLDHLDRTLRRIEEAAGLRREARLQYGLEGLIGQSQKIRDIFRNVRKIARSEAAAVFIRGESGTGKDALARAIHYESRRAPRPFVTILCTALQDTLLENDLFGHEKGAYTDARGQKRGLFETADGGSIFLNEIGDMGAPLQSKLLRVLDEMTFRRVGGSEDIRVDVRVIAATNRDLEQTIREGRFRADLFYRLNIFPVTLPPLRERKEDIPLFVEHFMKRSARKYRRTFDGLSRQALAKLQAYDWPGNVRELRNVLERACALAPGPEIRDTDLTFWRMGAEPEKGRALLLPPGGVKLEEVEKDLVVQALARADGNQTLAAGLLGISRFRLRNRMKRYGLAPTAPNPALHPSRASSG